MTERAIRIGVISDTHGLLRPEATALRRSSTSMDRSAVVQRPPIRGPTVPSDT